MLEESGEKLRIDAINAPGKVYIFGCGHVSRELEPVLSHVGFRCVVMDDREEFAQRELFPTAEEVKLVDFGNIEEVVSIGETDYVCVMTRGHSFDTQILAQVLKYSPRYVGVIGSRTKAAACRRSLLEDYGVPREQVDRIISPIGLDLGGRTPEEIAISIAAQMIQVRAGR